MNSKYIFALLTVALMLVPITSVAAATATITPTTVSTLTNFPVSFEVTGLNASKTINVYVNGILTTTFTSSTAGSGSFSVTVTTAGMHSITLKENNYPSVIASATVNATDILEILIPCVILIVTITLVMSIVKMIRL